MKDAGLHGRVKIAVIFILPLMVLFGRILLGGQVLFWGTPLLQFYPWRILALAALRAGQVPLWNPYLGNGAPLAANLQSAIFYPPNWLYFLGPVEWLMGIIAVLHVLWAGLGMFAFARTLGLRPFAAAVSGLSFMLSGYLIARLGFLSMTTAYAWLPWLLLGVERIVTRCRLADALLLGLMLGLQLLAGHAQTSFYSGLALVAYAAFRIGVINRKERQERENKSGFLFAPFAVRIRLLALAALLGIGLAAIQLVPTGELMQLSQRSAGLDYDFAMTYSFWPWRLLTLWAPNFFGQPANGNYWGYGAYWEDDGYLGVLPLLLASASIVTWRRKRHPLVPFFAGMALVALVLALGRNTPIYPWLFRHVPGFGLFQAPARLLALYTLAVSVLAGIGAEAWQFSPHPQPLSHTAGEGRRSQGHRPLFSRLGRGGGGVRGLLVGPALLIAGLAARSFLPPARLSFSDGALWLGAGVTGSALLAQLRPRREDRVARWEVVILAFIAADLVLADFGLNPVTGAELYQRPTQAAASLQAAGGRTFIFREDEQELKFRRFFRFDSFAPPDGGWFAVREAQLPNSGMIEGLASANNFDPLLVGRYADLLAAVEAAPDPTPLLRLMAVTTIISPRTLPGYERILEEAGINFYRVAEPLPRAFLATQIRHAASGAEALALITRPAFDPRREVVLEGLPHNTDFEYGDTDESAESMSSMLAIRPVRDGSPTVQPVPIIHEDWNSITLQVETPGPAVLVLSDTSYPGWQAFVDGTSTPIWRANYAFRAVPVPGGKHEVVFRYEPASFAWGWRITLVSLIVLLILAGASVAGHRHQPSDA